MEQYTGKETFQILLHRHFIRGVVEDWLAQNIEADMRLRRAKTEKHIVIETNSVMFANRIRMWHPDCKINIKK